MFSGATCAPLICSFNISVVAAASVGAFVRLKELLLWSSTRHVVLRRRSSSCLRNGRQNVCGLCCNGTGTTSGVLNLAHSRAAGAVVDREREREKGRRVLRILVLNVCNEWRGRSENRFCKLGVEYIHSARCLRRAEVRRAA